MECGKCCECIDGVEWIKELNDTYDIGGDYEQREGKPGDRYI